MKDNVPEKSSELDNLINECSLENPEECESCAI